MCSAAGILGCADEGRWGEYEQGGKKGGPWNIFWGARCHGVKEGGVCVCVRVCVCVCAFSCRDSGCKAEGGLAVSCKCWGGEEACRVMRRGGEEVQQL